VIRLAGVPKVSIIEWTPQAWWVVVERAAPYVPARGAAGYLPLSGPFRNGRFPGEVVDGVAGAWGIAIAGGREPLP
jgi:hypothetical protein